MKNRKSVKDKVKEGVKAQSGRPFTAYDIHRYSLKWKIELHTSQVVKYLKEVGAEIVEERGKRRIYQVRP